MKQHLKNTFLLLPIAASLPVQAQEKSESPNLVFITPRVHHRDREKCTNENSPAEAILRGCSVCQKGIMTNGKPP